MTKTKPANENTGYQANSLDGLGDNFDIHLLDLAFEPIVVRQFNGKITYWNRGAADLYGFNKDEAIGKPSHELLKTVFPVPLQEVESQILEEGSWFGELIHAAKDGRKLIVESRHQLFNLENGEQLVLETNRDITEPKTLYRTIFEGMQEGVAYGRMIYDEEGQPKDWIYLDVNPAYEKIVGISGLKGRSVIEMLPGLREKAPGLFKMYGRVARTGKPEVFEGYIEALDKWVHISAFCPAKDLFIGIGKDISQRKQMENALYKSRAHLKTFVEQMPAAMAMLDKELRYVAFSHRWLEDYGLGDQNLTGRKHYEVFPEIVDKSDWQSIHQRALAGEILENSEDKFIRGDGSVTWLKWEVRPWFDESNEIGGILILTDDITKKKKAEEELRESEQSLRLALDAAEIGMWDWDQSTDMVALDEREYELFGFQPDEFTGHVSQIFQRIHPDDLDKVKDAVDQSISKNLPYMSEFRVIHPDGQVIWLAGLGQKVEDSNHGFQRMIGVNFDITSRKHADQERDKYTRLENMAQMHRLHIAGEFAALLAHQLNQPLTAIRSFAEAGITQLRRGKLQPEQMREILSDVVEQSERAAGSIRDLRKFLARQPMEMIQGNINAEVNAACSLMDVLARGRNIKISLNLGVELPNVPMRTSQIEQIIVNLIENAMDAINHADPSGGNIEISTTLDEGKQNVLVAIEDSGPGLSAATVGQVFDPLYTTKKNGIGMGLAISRSIISNHGGKIWAEPGPGGHFFFTLPVTTK